MSSPVIETIQVGNTEYDIRKADSSGGIDYSTSEQDTGLKWIDGKSIYQKTGVSNNHTGDVSVALPTGADGSTIVSLNAYKISGSDFLPFGVIWDTSNSINVYATGSTLHLIDTKGNRSGTFYYTIQYTKTTD